MFVITADQVGSRSGTDLVATAIEAINDGPARPVLAAERTVGDELQVLVENGDDALTIILRLARTERWSIGCGAGEVATPLPRDIREATGPAFIAARNAVERAKKRPTRFALEQDPGTQAAADAEALLDLLLVVRSRRSPEGWEVHDLLEAGLSQAEAAARLDITPQAVSLRARAAELRAESAAREPLVRILDRLGSVETTQRGERA